MKSAAIGIVRNAVDIAPLTALHHWLLGCDRVWIIDNGSSDGTYEALLRLQAQLPGLRIDRDDGPYDQAGWTSNMATALAREGFDLIIPFDADECWNLSPAAVVGSMRRRGVNVICAPVVNYVQARTVRHASDGGWRQANRRVERAYSPDLHASLVMGTGQLSFVERAFPRKVLLAPPQGAQVLIVKGNRRVDFDGAKLANRRNFACLHLPLRAASELEKRVVDYRDRHRPFRLHPAAGWRLDYWAEMLESGTIDREWAANSYDADGMLDVFGARRPTIRDDRLVRHLERAQAFRRALERKRSVMPLWPLRFAFKARPSPFKVPENIPDLPPPGGGA